MRTFTRPAAAAMAAAFVLCAPLAVPATAAPTIPDNLPVFPQVNEDPHITVTRADGTPVTAATPVHRGDELIVHGTGFSPEANKGGLPLPIPPGTSNGVYVLYGAFPDEWKPSTGAPSSARMHPHDRMAWVLPDGTLANIPQGSIDMRRSIERESQPMRADGSFDARIVVNPPEQPTGDNWGIYVYPGAASINAGEEIYVPIPFSPEPGPNTPAPSSPDLVLPASLLFKAADVAGGGINAKDGALKVDGDSLGFTRQPDQGDGIERYKGTAIATAKFTLAEVAIADPWVEPQTSGPALITAKVSRSYNVGPDEMVRVPIGIR